MCRKVLFFIFMLGCGQVFATSEYTCRQFISDAKPEIQLNNPSVSNFVKEFNKAGNISDAGGMALLSLFSYCYNKKDVDISSIDAKLAVKNLQKYSKQDAGKLSYKFSNGDSYEGFVKDGKYTKGTYTYANGDSYEGTYKDGFRSGKGIYKFANGNIYTGEYKNDQYNGNGIYEFANGEKYVGEFKNGQYEGKGTYTYASGRVESGKWSGGVFAGKTTAQAAVASEKQDPMLACLQDSARKVVENCRATNCAQDTIVDQVKIVQQAQCGYSAIDTGRQSQSTVTTPIQQQPTFIDCTSRRNINGEISYNCMQY